MNSVKLAALAILVAFGTTMADEKIERKMAIKVVVDGDAAGDNSAFQWSSDAMGFDLQDLVVGETRTIENESGQPVTITRGEDGFTMDIDGQTVDLPNLGEHGAHMAFVDTDGLDHDIDVQIIDDTHATGAHQADGVTIISSKPLDASVRESIKSVLMSAGNNDAVTFIDGTEDAQRVMVMKKVEIIK
ncbi:MAG: hypothetical protein ACR2Q3_01770 [Woeseiaceae bacterium]